MAATLPPQRRSLVSNGALVSRIALVITFLLLIYDLPIFLQPGLGETALNLVEHLYVLIWLLVVTFWTRTVSLSTLITFLLVGLFTTSAVNLLISYPLALLVGVSSPLVSDLFAPVIEEIVKALPVFVFFFWMARRNRWQPGASDGLLLGWVVGAGFALTEDSLGSRIAGSGWFGSFWNVLFPTATAQNSIYSLFQIILGHAGWTAFVGLAIGLAFMYRHYRFTRVIPLIALGMVMLDHSISNIVGNLGRKSAPLFVSLLRTLLLNGQLVVLLLLLGIVAVIALDLFVLRRTEPDNRMFPSLSIRFLIDSARGPMNRAQLTHLRNELGYRRLRRAATYAVWFWSHGTQPPPNATEMGLLLHQTGTSAGLVQPSAPKSSHPQAQVTPDAS